MYQTQKEKKEKNLIELNYCCFFPSCLRVREARLLTLNQKGWIFFSFLPFALASECYNVLGVKTMMTAAPTRCFSLLTSISVSRSVVEPPVRVRRQSLRYPQPAVARPDVLPHAHDAAARLRLRGTRHQEPGPSLYALRSGFT